MAIEVAHQDLIIAFAEDLSNALCEDSLLSVNDFFFDFCEANDLTTCERADLDFCIEAIGERNVYVIASLARRSHKMARYDVTNQLKKFF